MSPPAHQAGPEDPLDAMAMAMSSVVRSHFTVLLDERQGHLGKDDHIRAVLRRVACGEPGAVMMDGHYLLTLEAHHEECALKARRSKAPPSAPPAGGAHA